MLDEATGKTMGCRFKFKCLGKDPQHPVCTVVDANGKNVLFVNNAIDSSCQYRVTFGYREVCTCPTHYALHHKQDRRMNGTTVPGIQESPPPSQSADARKIRPQTVDATVEILIEELPLLDRVAMANLGADDVGELTSGFIDYVRDAFGLGSGNNALLLSCSEEAGFEIEHPDDASAIILARLVMALVKTHKARSDYKMTEVPKPGLFTFHKKFAVPIQGLRPSEEKVQKPTDRNPHDRLQQHPESGRES